LETTDLTNYGKVRLYSIQPIPSKPDKGCIVLFTLDFYLLPRFTSANIGFDNVSTMLLMSCNTGEFNAKLSRSVVFNEATVLRPPVISAYSIFELPRNEDDYTRSGTPSYIIMVIVFLTAFVASFLCLLTGCLYCKLKQDRHNESWARWEDQQGISPQKVPQTAVDSPPCRSELSVFNDEEISSAAASSIDDRKIIVELSSRSEHSSQFINV
jgi:hypothetical protein